jgi:hypothetical protein
VDAVRRVRGELGEALDRHLALVVELVVHLREGRRARADAGVVGKARIGRPFRAADQ